MEAVAEEVAAVVAVARLLCQEVADGSADNCSSYEAYRTSNLVRQGIITAILSSGNTAAYSGAHEGPGSSTDQHALVAWLVTWHSPTPSPQPLSTSNMRLAFCSLRPSFSGNPLHDGFVAIYEIP